MNRLQRTWLTLMLLWAVPGIWLINKRLTGRNPQNQFTFSRDTWEGKRHNSRPRLIAFFNEYQQLQNNVRLNKYSSQECNSGPYIANTYVWKTVFRQDNVIDVWRLLRRTAPDTSQTNTGQSTELQNYIISRWHRPCMTYGRKRRKALRGAIQMRIQRDIRQSTHALVWTLTYLHLNFNGSKFFRSHTWKLQRMEIWRRSQVEEPFFPLSFQFNVSNIGIDYRSRKVCREF